MKRTILPFPFQSLHHILNTTVKHKTLILWTLSGAIFTISALAEPRAFTSKEGKSFTAEPIKVTATEAVFKRVGTSNVTVPINRFILEDQQYLKQWAEEEKKNRIPKVEIHINTNKRDRRQDNAYEDRKGEFQFEIAIENEERNFDLKGANATLIAMGSDMDYDNKGQGVIMERTEFKKIDIEEGKTTTVKGKLVRFEYDKRGYTHGEKYTGYLFQLRTAQGKIIETRGSTPRIENDAELILKLKQDESFDERTFKSLAGSAIRR